MQTKRRVILAALIISLFAVSAVSANDNVSVADTNDGIIKEFDNPEILDVGENTGTFEELDSLVQNADTLKLNKSYSLSKEIVINKDITIDGGDYTLDANGESRIFYIENSNVVLKNLNFINARSLYGGAIYAGFNSNLTIIGCTFINCSANFGGALTVLSSNTEISQSCFEYNTAAYDGGAIFSMYGDLKLSGNTFLNNTATRAGAVYSSLNDFTFINNQFLDNRAVNVGAVYVMAGNRKTVSGNVFSNNTGFDDVYETVNDNLTIYSDDYYYPFNYKSVEYPALPDYYDIRDYVNLTDVKDQGVEGNCWAFSAMAVLESCILKASGIPFDFSESNLKNLMAYYSDWGRNIETNGGGNLRMVSGYFASWLGPISDEDDVYSTNNLLSPVLKSILHVQNIIYLKRTDYLANNDFKNAIMRYGAISTGMYYDSDYLEDRLSYYYPGYEATNHEVCIVGWNDTYSRFNFKDIPEGDGAWIVRNSWGPSWGDGGYFYVSYYDSKFAEINETDSYTIILNDSVRLNRIYQYDSLVTSYSSDDYSCFKNVFTVEGGENLAAVSTYFSASCDYVLTVYVNDNNICTKSGNTDAGYYTIILDEAIPLSKNDNVTVVFNCSNFEDGEGTIPLSFKSSTVNLFLAENRSYFWNGRSWVDLYYSNATACIKIFTTTHQDGDKYSPYFNIGCEFDYADNAFIITFILPGDAEGLVEVNTTGGNHIVNLSNARSVKLYNLNANNNTLSIRYCGDDRYFEKSISYVVDINVEYMGDFEELASKIGETKNGGVLDLHKDYADSTSMGEIDIIKPITIDGHGHTISGANISRIFYIFSDNVILKNIRFIEANCDGRGAAVYVYGANCHIINCTFINNTASNYGGAVYLQNEGGIIMDSYFENNSAGYGGAVFSFDPISISNSKFVKNMGSYSVVYLSNCNANSILNSSFMQNEARFVVYVNGNDTIITDSYFDDNVAYRTVLYLSGNNQTVDNSTFSNSLSYEDSAAVLIYGDACVLNDCTFERNIGNDNGGAISISGDNCNLTNSKFIDNTALNGYYGGAVYLKGNNVMISDSTFINNTAEIGGALFVSSGSENCILTNSFFANNTGNYQIYWNNDNSGLIECCRFTGSTGNNVRAKGATVIKNTLTLASHDYSIDYKNPNNLSVRFNIADGVSTSKPIAFTVSGNTYNLYLDNDSAVLSYQLANLNAGALTVHVTFDGDDNYDALDSSFTLTINEAASSLSLKTDNATLNHKTLLAAYVTDSADCPIAEGSVTFYDGQTRIGSSNVNEGVATFVYTPTLSGEHSIRAVYDGINYLGSDDLAKLLVDDATVSLSLNPGVVGSASIFTANVNLLYGSVEGQSVSFYVDDALIGSVSLQNGAAYISFTPKTAGTHTVKTVFESEKFSRTQDAKIYDVAKASSQVSIQTPDATVGYASTITARVTSNSLAVGEGNAVFYDDGNRIGSCSVQNGIATLSYTPKTAGNHNVSVAFGSDNYDSSTDYMIVQVQKASITLTVHDLNNIIYLDNVRFKVSVLSNGNPVNEGTVRFYVGDALIGSSDVVNGIANVNYDVLILNPIELSVIFDETSNYLGSNAAKSFTVSKIPTNLAGNPITVVYNVLNNLVVSLKDNNGKPIAQETLTLSFNGVKTFKTDANGQIRLSSMGLAPRTYDIVVTFSGGDNYAKSTLTTKIVVLKATPKITAAKKTFKRKVKTKKYTITLKTHQNKALGNVKVAIKINGKTYSAKTNAKGKATFKIKKLTRKGSYKSQITFGGDAYYNRVTKTVKIIVK